MKKSLLVTYSLELKENYDWYVLLCHVALSGQVEELTGTISFGQRVE